MCDPFLLFFWSKYTSPPHTQTKHFPPTQFFPQFFFSKQLPFCSLCNSDSSLESVSKIGKPLQSSLLISLPTFFLQVELRFLPLLVKVDFTKLKINKKVKGANWFSWISYRNHSDDFDCMNLFLIDAWITCLC